jgi:hypothetical protein
VQRSLSGSFLGGILDWSRRNQKSLIVSSVLCIVALFFCFLLASSIKLLPAGTVNVMHLVAVVASFFVILSVAPRGIVPVLIALLGLVLIDDAVTLPLYASEWDGQRMFWTIYSPEAASVAGALHFFLGVSMIAFGMIIAHRPSMLFTHNRPPSAEAEWSSYPIWHDNAVLADGRTEQVIPVKSLMTAQDHHLLWRYEYVLVRIYGALHLVRPEGMVPRESTTLLRDKPSGRLLGKARYSGFFV